jgi:hypothetical protein
MNPNVKRFGVALLAGLFLASCSAAYYSAMEGIGFEKREILVDRVEDARDAQDEAAEQFASALDQFRSLVEVDGGELEKTYDRLSAAYERSLSRANEVSDRVDSVARVADDLFEEWEDELDDYSSDRLRRDSARLLSETRGRYRQLMTAMRRAESSMPPVLSAFQDQVLVLKHNLNARAIGALRGELGNIERETEQLIADMRTAIGEANSFIKSMQ